MQSTVYRVSWIIKEVNCFKHFATSHSCTKNLVSCWLSDLKQSVNSSLMSMLTLPTHTSLQFPFIIKIVQVLYWNRVLQSEYWQHHLYNRPKILCALPVTVPYYICFAHVWTKMRADIWKWGLTQVVIHSSTRVDVEK